MADLLALKKIRSAVKGSLTRMENFINSNANKMDEISIDELKVRLDTVQALRGQFLDIEAKMYVIDPETESQMEEFEPKYYSVESSINGYQSAEIKLKKLSIPPFSGEYTEWPSFYDLYNTSIHSKDYPAVQKFQYLKSLLIGEAAQLIRYITVTEANYYEAFSKLVERYNRKKYIVNAFIRTFMDQPTINQVSSSSIRKLRDTSDEVLRGLKALDTKAETRDSWLIYILIKKLDQETKMLWAQESTASEYPTTKEFFDFLNKRCDALESMSSYTKTKPMSTRSLVTEAIAPKGATWSCPICKGETHLLFECKQFVKMPLASRKGVISEDKRCYNCLHKGHSVYNCRARSRCKICHRKHHSLLHDDATHVNASSHVTSLQESSNESKPSTSKESEPEAHVYQTTMLYAMQAVLPTAVVRVKGSNGEFKLCRALLDSASQVTFITDACVQKLGLIITSGRMMVSGLGQANLGRTKGVTQLQIEPRSYTEPGLKVQAYVVPKITSLEPASKINCAELDKLKSINLADPNFHKNGNIDLLLGVEVFFAIIENEQLRLSPRLVAQKTRFGWVIGGQVSADKDKSNVVNFNVTMEVDSTLRRFWEIESIPTINDLTDEEKYCEEWFGKTTQRSGDGKFVVKLPVSGKLTSLGSNYFLAKQRFKAMENKFLRNPEFKEQYHNFINEYIQLGHMEEINKGISMDDYFLPHPGVIKDTSTTTKMRVVFDASSKDVNGLSLNDLLRTGPTIKSSLLVILLKFRTHQYVISGDVEKMYRQVWVHPDDTKYQRVLWRTNINEPIKQYELKTLTYGTASASFLSTRCIKQAAQENAEKYPAAAAAIQTDMYVDDLMTGANDEDALIRIREEIVNILDSSGFKLRKWTTNSPRMQNLLKTQGAMMEKSITEDETLKLLGLKWNPHSDGFCFSVCLTERTNHSKRTLLSEASRIFDPLGWLSPITIRIKILFQSLWLRDLRWDDQLPDDVCSKWIMLRNELKGVEKLVISRWLQFSDEVELHGFSDASELAYSGVVYAKTRNSVYLIAGKTKVSPIRQLSLPRLELLGAVLLTELVNTIQASWAHIKIIRTVLWCDSKIVLDWLSSHPRKWNAFVANRISTIVDQFPREFWRHVPSKYNAADCASRGITVDDFVKENCIWWNGPEWLQLEEERWPEQRSWYQTEVEKKCKNLDVLLTTANSFFDDLLKRYSSYGKLKKILAYIKRYINHLKWRIDHRGSVDTRRKSSSLTPEEILCAEITIIRYVQRQYFITEIKCLEKNQEIPRKSSLKALNPFLDKDGIIRVGGRITNPTASYNTKHPAVLPTCASISKSIMLDCHIKWLHAGCGLLVSLSRKRFWIIRARDVARLVIHRCIKCIRYKPNLEQQLMGDLPPARVRFTYPFINVGVDYCGPFKVQLIRRRGQIPVKMYVCIFVCLSTKAVHIEVASDMSSRCYLGVLRRFIARRGMCRVIYSDNGSNFVGANNQLKQWYASLKETEQHIQDELSKTDIQWSFNPASSPHMGGLWESAVKAMKSYLRKSVGETILTLEEFTTLLCQIEAIMNSRPICALGGDELDILTPGHFLIGRSFVEIPEPDLSAEKLSPLARWELVVKVKQHFQKRWQRDYLTSFQRRDRWQNKTNNILVGDVVLISDEYPSISWKLGRVMEVHPGVDGNVRVVTLKTTSGLLKRPIHKLCRLPVQSIESSDSRAAECYSSHGPKSSAEIK